MDIYSIESFKSERIDGKGLAGTKEEQMCKIEGLKHYQHCKELVIIELARYLRRDGDEKARKMIVRYKCSNEENANKYWLKEKERKYRMCEKKEETFEYSVRMDSRLMWKGEQQC